MPTTANRLPPAFANNKLNSSVLFEATLTSNQISHKRIGSYPPRHDRKAARNSRINQKRSHDTPSRYTLAGLSGRLAVRKHRSDSRPCAPLTDFRLLRSFADTQSTMDKTPQERRSRCTCVIARLSARNPLIGFQAYLNCFLLFHTRCPLYSSVYGCTLSRIFKEVGINTFRGME